MSWSYPRHGKRVLDLVLGGLALGSSAPLLAAAALLVRHRLGSPVLFRQQRIGRGERPFYLLKLRTMTDARDEHGRLRPDADRLLPLGRWLRRHGIDELPSLVNVLRGELSLVGPRPLLPEYLPWYTAKEATRHRVRPGLTGWAQVHGRNAVDWDERLSLDAGYVERVSLRLDLKIMLRTVAVVLRGQGQSAPGHATMPRLDTMRSGGR
ncbi:MAG: sugar transferase [Myxococcota bacterium]